MTGERVRELRWNGCLNVRDLGGLPLASGGRTKYGVVVRSAFPGELDAPGWRLACEHGLRSVVDLRCPSEAEYLPPAGVRRLSTPIFLYSDRSLDHLYAAARSAAEFYDVWISHRAAAVGAAVRAVAEAESTVLVHCQAGRDRTGVVCALLLAVAGVTDEAIAEDYAASREALRPLYEELFAEADPAERARLERESSSPPEAMHELLSRIRATHGRVEGYLRTAGVEHRHLEAIRTRLAA